MRGRKPIQLDKAEFQSVITLLENTNQFANRTLLWQAVEASEWAKSRLPRPLTAQVAMMKADEFGLEIKTTKGKRGRSKGEGPIAGGGRKKKFFDVSQIVETIPPDMREGLSKTIQKAQSGSLKARIKLKCLECSVWQKGEVANCQVTDCALFDVRPYKRVGMIELTVVENEPEDKEMTPV